MFVQIEADPDAGDDRESRLFPDKGREVQITCAALTSDFLMFGTEVCSSTWFCLCMIMNARIMLVVW